MRYNHTSDEYSKKCYLIRNSYIVEMSQRVIAVFDGNARSGTSQTIEIAKRKKRELVIININSEEAIEYEKSMI